MLSLDTRSQGRLRRSEDYDGSLRMRSWVAKGSERRGNISGRELPSGFKLSPFEEEMFPIAGVV